jgi:hypothetical protein
VFLIIFRHQNVKDELVILRISEHSSLAINIKKCRSALVDKEYTMNGKLSAHPCIAADAIIHNLSLENEQCEFVMRRRYTACGAGA